MAKKSYVGINNQAKSIPDIGYVGIANKAKKLIKGYVGDANGKAQQFWPGIIYDGVLFLKEAIWLSRDIFQMPALVNRPEKKFSSSNTHLDLREYKSLFMSRLGIQNVLWPDITYNYPLLEFDFYITNEWHIEDDSIYKIISSNDYRTSQIMFLPVSRMYIDAEKQYGQDVFHIEVEVKGKSSIGGALLTISACYIDDYGNFVTAAYGRLSVNSDNYIKITVRMSGYSCPYIDYIGFDAEYGAGYSGVNSEIYIRSCRVVEYKYKKCFAITWDEVKRNHLDYNYQTYQSLKLIIPCAKNKLSINFINMDFDIFKASGNDDVYIIYEYTIQDWSSSSSNKEVWFLIKMLAVSKKQFSITYDTYNYYASGKTRKTENAVLYQYWNVYALSPIICRYIKTGSTIDFSSPVCPISDIAPSAVENSVNLYAMLYYGKYYDGLKHKKATHPIDEKITYNIPQPIMLNTPILWQYYGGQYNKEYVKTSTSDVYLVIWMLNNSPDCYYFSENSFQIIDDYNNITHNAYSVIYHGKTYYFIESNLHLSRPTDHDGIVYDYTELTDVQVIIQNEAFWQTAYIIFDGTIEEYET